MNNLKERINHLIDEQQLAIQIQDEIAKRQEASVPPPGLVPGPTYGRVVRVQTHLNVRSSPNFDHNIIGTLPVGSTVEIIGSEGDFYRLSFPGYEAAYGLKSKIQVIDSKLPAGTGDGLSAGQIAALSTAAYIFLT